jgi:hypothetical protein
MSVITGNSIFIDNFPMQFSKVTFTDAGDSITIKNPYRGISKEDSISRHILVNGWVNVAGYLNGEKVGDEYTETPYISKLRYGLIISPKDSADIDTGVSTATEDNSAIFCIHPATQREMINNTVNDAVRDKVWRIPSGQPFRLQTGRLYFSNVDLEINGQIRTAFEPIACVYREFDAVPSVDAAIAEFWVEKIFISKQNS